MNHCFLARSIRLWLENQNIVINKGKGRNHFTTASVVDFPSPSGIPVCNCAIHKCSKSATVFCPHRNESVWEHSCEQWIPCLLCFCSTNPILQPNTIPLILPSRFLLHGSSRDMSFFVKLESWCFYKTHNNFRFSFVV